MEIKGVPPNSVLAKSTRRHLFFDESNSPILKENSRGKVRRPNTKTLNGVLRCKDKNFLDLIRKCLEWDPEKRITPVEAL